MSTAPPHPPLPAQQTPTTNAATNESSIPSNALPFETPLDSVRHMTKINKAAVKRVAILAGNDAYKCLITLVSRSCTIVLAHVVGRNNVPHEELRKLEHILGVEPDKFNADSSRNIFYLSSEKHYSFDHRGWAMVPTLELMMTIERSFLNALRKYEEDPDIVGELKFTPWKEHEWVADRHDYHIVPLLLHKHRAAIIRGGDDPCYWGGEGFPVVSSWIDPIMALWNTGQKLRDLHGDPSFSFLLLPHTIVPLLSKAYQIWTMWQKMPLPSRYIPEHKPQKSPSRQGPTTHSSRAATSVANIQPRRGAGSVTNPAAFATQLRQLNQAQGEQSAGIPPAKNKRVTRSSTQAGSSRGVASNAGSEVTRTSGAARARGATRARGITRTTGATRSSERTGAKSAKGKGRENDESGDAGAS